MGLDWESTTGIGVRGYPMTLVFVPGQDPVDVFDLEERLFEPDVLHVYRKSFRGSSEDHSEMWCHQLNGEPCHSPLSRREL